MRQKNKPVKGTIQQECNFVRSLTHFHLLGRLFQLFPDLIRECLNQNSQFIRYVANGMAHQSEEVRSTIVYIFLQIYSSNFSAGNSVIAEIDFFIAKGILYVLESGITKDVIKNGLALLKVFISKDSKRVTLLFENLNEEANFLAVIRKIILSSDAAFQVCIVQCICFILSEKNEDIYIRKLIEGNVPELLFEVITGTNELLLETIFCCLVLFTHSPHFFEKCHVLYSISTILEATVALLNLKNMKLLALAFNLLISLVSNDNYLVATSTQTSLFQKALQLIEKTYKVHSPQVLLSANKLLFYLLKKESLSSFKFPLPLVQLFDILLSCLKNVQKYLSSHLLSSPQFRNSFENNMDDLPLEIKILINGLDIIYFFIQILKHQTKNPMSMEEIFSCPDVQNKSKSTAKINVQSVMQAIIDALDQIFVPCCLLLGYTTIISKISWYHLINVLSATFESLIDRSMLTLFITKLMKAKIFNYAWNLKVMDFSTIDKCLEQPKDVGNQCLKNILLFLMHSQAPSEYLNNLEDGITQLNGCIEECASVLSLKPEIQIQNGGHLCSMQSTFLCLVYNSYLYEGPIVNMKIVIPHLVYYITCNLDKLNLNLVNLKHLVFIVAICLYESMNKIPTGLIEVSVIVWDIIFKVTSPAEIYTHHKVILWWCFKNQQINLFSSYVLQIWLEYSLKATDTFVSCQATKILVNLLTTNTIAQETFVRQLDSNAEIKFSFLKKAFESVISHCEDTILKQRFDNLIQIFVNQMQNWLSKMLIVKNYEDLSKDASLSIGLESLLWCKENMENSCSQVDIKLVFHVTSFCCNSSLGNISSLLPCLKYLQYAVKVKSDDSKAWHIVTGNTNIVPLLRKCLSFSEQIKIEVLHLLNLLLEHQIHAELKCNTSITIPFSLIVKWMNCQSTKLLSIELLNNLLDAEFKGLFVQICSLEQNKPVSNQVLSRNDIRILTIYLQNALMLGNPALQKVTLESYKKLLIYTAKTDCYLENHIMLQPWLKILLESQLEDLPGSKDLFENWSNFKKVNVTLIGVMDQFANRILDMPNVAQEYKTKLNMGTYKNLLKNETILKLSEVSAAPSCNKNNDTDLITEIENFIADRISNLKENA